MEPKNTPKKSINKDENSISVFFGSRLRMLRAERTQGEFAAELGIGSQQTYARYEAGRLPPVEVLQRIARRLGVSVDSLLEEGPAPTPNTSRPGPAHSASAAALTAMSEAEVHEVLLCQVAQLQRELPGAVRAHCYAAISDAAAELARRIGGTPAP